MVITKVEVFLFDGGSPFVKPPAVRVWTDEGIYGDGEGSVNYGTGAEGVYGTLEALCPLIVGMDPLANEVIWNKLHKTTFWGQSPGPIFFSAVSAIDIALWDIRGKYYGKPLYMLLGGKQRDSIRCYASQIHYGFREQAELCYTPEQYADVTQYCVEEGYDAVKIDFVSFDDAPGKPFGDEQRRGPMKPHFVSLTQERLQAIRDRVGPNVDIIMENHSNLDAVSAVQLGRACEPYGIMYFEEPNTPSPKTSKYIADNIRIPIANGERIFTRWQYLPYFENQSLQVAQPDLTSCGGLTEGKKICDIAHAYDVTIQLHVCGTPLSTQLALHLETAIPNFLIHEEHRCCMNPGLQALCKEYVAPIRGKRYVTETPGIGNEWSDRAIREALRHRVITEAGTTIR